MNHYRVLLVGLLSLFILAHPLQAQDPLGCNLISSFLAQCPTDQSTPINGDVGVATTGNSVPIAGAFNDFMIAQQVTFDFQPTPAARWNEFFCVGTEICAVGDFNGDGKDDIAAFAHTNDGASNVWVATSSGTNFGDPAIWSTYFCVGQEICAVGDVNGDGKDDLVAFVRGTGAQEGDGDVWVALSNGSSFGDSMRWHTDFCYGQEICKVGDFNGDGRDDIAAFVRGDGTHEGDGSVWIALTARSSFGKSSVWNTVFCIKTEICEVADVNGDGKDDIVAFTGNTGETTTNGSRVWVGLANDTNGFAQGSDWSDPTDFCFMQSAVCTLGDINGDGKADAMMFYRDTDDEQQKYRGLVFGLFSNGSRFQGVSIGHNYFCVGAEICAVGDFDGNGSDDIIAFVRDTQAEPGRGDVWVALSTLTPPRRIGDIVNSIDAIEGLDLPAPQIGGYAVVTEQGNQLQVHTGAGTQYEVITRLMTGEEVLVLEGPIAVGGINWWRIQRNDSTTGWVAEGDGAKVWLIGSTSSGGTDYFTAGQLNVGDQAVVTNDGDGLRIRSSAGTQFSASGDLRRGDVVCVLDGPTDADGLRWWRISNASGTTGWVAEGDNTEVWLTEQTDSQDLQVPCN